MKPLWRGDEQTTPPLSRAGAATRKATSKPRLQEGTPMEYRQNAADAGASPWMDIIVMLAAALLAQRWFQAADETAGPRRRAGYVDAHALNPVLR